MKGNSGNNAATFMALGVLILAAIAFLVLVAMVVPSALGVFAVGLGFSMFIAFHYLVWGWWLGDRLNRADQAAESESES